MSRGVAVSGCQHLVPLHHSALCAKNGARLVVPCLERPSETSLSNLVSEVIVPCRRQGVDAPGGTSLVTWTATHPHVPVHSRMIG